MFKKVVSMAMAGMMAVCLACLSACASESNSGLPSAKIGTLATEDILPLWVAESEGLFEQAGLDADVVVFQSATELIAAVSAGEVGFAMTDPMVSAALYASGTDVQIEWITLGATAKQGRFGIMTCADSGITNISQLAGQEIGVGSNTILEYVMDTLLLQAGVPEDQIVKAEIQKLPVRYEQMASGQVAAAALPASLLALGEANGCVLIADDTQENISQSVMIARTDFLAEDQGETTLSLMKNVWNQAAGLINASPDQYRALLVEKANLPEAIAASYPVSEYPLCELPTNDMIAPVLDWMLHKGYLSEPLSYDAATGEFSK